MRIVICDDDPKAVSRVHDMVAQFFEARRFKMPHFDCYLSGEEFLKDKYDDVDFAFLDIEMPGVSGIHVGRKIKAQNPFAKIFIVTSYGEYLDEAMRFRVFRYLTKPLDKERLYRNLRDALKQYATEFIELPLVTKDEVFTVRSSDICLVESDHRNTKVYTRKGCFSSLDTMEYWSKRLDLGTFFQTYRSYLVNITRVNSFTASMIKVGYGDNQETIAYLARRRSKDFREQYMLLMENRK